MNRISVARRRRSVVSIVSAAALIIGVAVTTASPATADQNPASVAAAAAAVTGAPTTDSLPTVQIDGVVWAQALNGDTVYAAGKFGNARPAGSAVGQNQTVRRNLLAFDINTGNLITSFVPDLNAQARAVAVSPDGKTLYVGGDFTVANGVKHYRLAAYNTATGAIIKTFAPSVDNPVKAIVATNTTVYIGGSFASVNGVPRAYLAALSAATGSSTDGTLTGWDPSANAAVTAMVFAPGGQSIVAGGMFSTVGGAAAYGMTSIDATSGALRPWAANTVIKDAGENGAISSLTTDGTSIYGTGYAHGTGSNFEGSFSADPATGVINWLEDCHGDSYGNFARGGALYVVGHSHDCNNIKGYPQSIEGRRAVAFYNSTTGTVNRNLVANYANFAGQPSTSLLNWFPLIAAGTFTGQAQAAWSITGNSKYLVLGGEFPTVNTVGQQGLVRFPTRADATAAGILSHGPEVAGALNNPTLTSLAAGTVRVAFRTNWDRDDTSLSYRVVRDGTTQVYTKVQDSTFFDRPYLSFVDSGLAVGSTHTYRVYVTDGTKTSSSETVSVTVSGTDTSSSYVNQVKADGAANFWRLGEASGTVAYDWAGGTDAIVGTAVTRGAAGSVLGSNASTFNGTANATVISPYSSYGPQTFSVQSWVKTTSTGGGEFLGFGSANTGSSPLNDRVLYMDNAGRIYFGVTTAAGGVAAVASSGTFNNGQWHQVTGTLSSTGLRLYVDGVQVAARTDTTTAMGQYGWWRLGGDNLTGYPGTKTNSYFNGSIDEAAIYPTELSASQIAAQYALRSSVATNKAPTAAFTASSTDLTAAFDGTTSTDADGTISSYAWNFGDNSTGSGATTSHAYAAAGTYNVVLTVTDNNGATGSITKAVSVTAPVVVPGGPLAGDDFERTVASGFGTAVTGGTWTAASTTSVAGGVGLVPLATGGASTTVSLNSVSAADVDFTADFGLDKRVVGGSAYVSLQARKVTAGGYRVKTVVAANGGVTLSLVRLTGSTETTIAAAPATGLTYVVGSSLRVRFQIIGSTLNAKIWNAAGTEPAAWNVTGTDTTYAAAGSVGIYNYISGGATNAPVTVRLDNLSVTKP